MSRHLSFQPFALLNSSLPLTRAVVPQVQEEVSTLRREVSQKSEESRQRQSLLEKQIQELETRANSTSSLGWQSCEPQHYKIFNALLIYLYVRNFVLRIG